MDFESIQKTCRNGKSENFCGAFSKATASPKLFRFIKTSEKDYAFPTRTRRSALRNRVRGSPAREGFSLKRSRKAHFFLLELYFGSCCARQLKSERFSTVKSLQISVSRASGGLCPLDTHKPFFEGLDPKIYRYFAPHFKRPSAQYRRL